MPQISRKPISKDIENKIYESFYRAIGLLKEAEARLFIDDLLTKTERVMLPKRLAIAILLLKGWNYASIKEVLCVTQTTIASVSRTLEFSTGLRKAIENLNKSEVWRSWWEGVEGLLYRLSSPGKVFLDGEVLKRKQAQRTKTLV